MARGHVAALVAGAVSAVLFLAAAFGSLGGVILAYLAQLPLFAAGLGAGWVAAAIAGAVAVALVLVTMPLASAGLFFISTAVPVLVLVRQALQSRPLPDGGIEWYPPGRLLAILSGMALALFIAMWLYHAGDKGGLDAASYDFVRGMLGGFEAAGTPEQLDRVARALARYFPAAVLASWQFMVIINGLLAQGVLAKFGRNKRPGEPFSSLTLPRWPTFVLAACAATAVFPGQLSGLGRNGAIIMCVPFFFVGLSVIHAVSAGWRGRPFLLAALYLFLLFARWPALIVTGLGVVEQWVKLRPRFAAAHQAKEEE